MRRTGYYLFALLVGLLCASLAGASSGTLGMSGLPLVTKLTISFDTAAPLFTPGEKAREALKDLAQANRVLIHGRTSATTPSKNNEVLAMQRALAARSWLIANGVAAEKIYINFLAAGDFAVDNTSVAGKKKNQRVDIEGQFFALSSTESKK